MAEMWLLPLISPLPPEGMEGDAGQGNCTPRERQRSEEVFQVGLGEGALI